MWTPSTSIPGKTRARAPVASTMCFAVSSRVEPSAAVSATRPGARSRAVPARWATPYFLKSPATPLLKRAATPRERDTTFSKSIVSGPADRPQASASRILWASSAVLSRAFDGMQPQFRHTPPSSSRSMQAVRSPSWAPRIAAG